MYTHSPLSIGTCRKHTTDPPSIRKPKPIQPAIPQHHSQLDRHPRKYRDGARGGIPAHQRRGGAKQDRYVNPVVDEWHRGEEHRPSGVVLPNLNRQRATATRIDVDKELAAAEHEGLGLEHGCVGPTGVRGVERDEPIAPQTTHCDLGLPLAVW